MFVFKHIDPPACLPWETHSEVLYAHNPMDDRDSNHLWVNLFNQVYLFIIWGGGCVCVVVERDGAPGPFT